MATSADLNMATIEQPNGGAAYYIPRCQTLREMKGKSMNDLAKAADVDRSRISLIERKQPVTGAIAGKVFEVLNDWHGKTLDYGIEVTKTPDLKRKQAPKAKAKAAAAT